MRTLPRPLSFPLAALAMAAALGLHAQAQAHEVSYAAPLLGSSEVPAAVTNGVGNALVVIDLDLLTMRVQVTFSGLTGNTTASHIHCCVSPGSNVGVATMLPTFTGFPLGVKSGSYDFTFNMALASSYNPAFITAHGGTVGSAFNDLLAGLDAGKAYLNVHTTAFGGGEIRGLLAPVPEPSTYALLAAGLGLVGWAARARQPRKTA